MCHVQRPPSPSTLRPSAERLPGRRTGRQCRGLAAGTCEWHLYLPRGAFNDVHSDATNTFIDALSATVSYTGSLQGTSTVNGKLILHADGTAEFHDTEVFTGTVEGTPGTLTFRLDGTTDRSGAVDATDVIVSATGDLASARGLLEEVGTVPNPAQGPAGTYTGRIQ